jgi:hypothetical protein
MNKRSARSRANSVRISQFSSAGEQMRKINGEVMSAAKDATEAKS